MMGGNKHLYYTEKGSRKTSGSSFPLHLVNSLNLHTIRSTNRAFPASHETQMTHNCRPGANEKEYP